MAQSIHHVLLQQAARSTDEFVTLISQQEGEYNALLGLLRAIKAGEVEIAQVQITDDGWRLAPPAPPTTNGTKAKAAAK